MKFPVVQRNSTLQGKSTIIKVFFFFFSSQRMWFIYKEINEHYKSEGEGKEFSDLHDYFFALYVQGFTDSTPSKRQRV